MEVIIATHVSRRLPSLPLLAEAVLLSLQQLSLQQQQEQQQQELQGLVQAELVQAARAMQPWEPQAVASAVMHPVLLLLFLPLLARAGLLHLLPWGYLHLPVPASRVMTPIL